MSSFLKRLASGIVLVLCMAAVCWYGSLPLWIFTVFIGYVGLHEFYQVFGLRETETLGAAGLIGTALWMGMVYAEAGGAASGKESLWLMLLLAFMLIMAVYVFTFPKYDTQKVMAAFFGIVYVPVMLSFIYQTRMLEGGFYLVWLIFFCSWGCDTFAYCTGMLIGRHKLAPVLSPKKSIEGAVGGVVGAAALGGIYAALMSMGHPDFHLSVPFCACLCAAGAVASQVGDLAASAIKRQHGIKDYGKLIPGHGGILDRFDSVIVTAPMIYILAVLFMR